jgi:ankyrin repeat protein
LQKIESRWQMKHLLITTIAAVVVVGTVFADPIHDAARNSDLAGVHAELDKGVDVNAKREGRSTFLHYAAFNGHKEIAELLIAKGADVNAKDGIGGKTTARMGEIKDHYLV